MKSVSIVIAAFLFCIGITVFQQFYIISRTEKITKAIEAMEESGRKRDEREIAEHMLKLKTLIRKTKPSFTLLTRHDDIDKIELVLLRVELCEDKKEYTAMLDELAVLKHYLKSYRDGEKPNIYNVF